MARRKRIKWENGAIFAVPLIDGSFGFAQAIDHWMPHWIYVALLKIRSQTLPEKIPSFSKDEIISLIAVSDDELDFGTWPLVGQTNMLVFRNDFPNEQFKSEGYVGAKSYDGGLASDFLSAFHCLSPWDDWYKPDYLDEFLISKELKPKKLIYKKRT